MIPLKTVSRKPEKCASAPFSLPLTTPLRQRIAFVIGPIASVVVMLSLIALSGGCASVATLKGIPGQTIEIELQFYQPVNTLNTAYVIAFSSTPISLPSIGKYLPLPGLDFSNDAIGTDSATGTLSDYYAHYFGTWTDYIMIGSRGIELHQHTSGNFFPSRLTTDDEHFSFIADTGFSASNSSAVNTAIKFSFPLNILSVQPSFLSFAIFTLYSPYHSSLAQSGRLIDQVNSSETQIQTIAVTEKQGNVFHSPGQNGEIKSWRVKVY